MKKYTSLGELLQDYREESVISQADFAANLNVDIRTVQRWENDQTLIKPEKEEDIVCETPLPYQLIRNLNAAVPIATYYDFGIRKYSLTPLTIDLPDATWLKEDLQKFTERIITIRNDSDIDLILKDIQKHEHPIKSVNKELIRTAIKLLPELNLIILDDSGYYSGHSITFPINDNTFEKLKNREISEEDLNIKDLVHYKQQKEAIFYNYDITADNNDNVIYLAHHYFRFFLKLQKTDYTYCSFSIRNDSFKLNKELGLKLVWEDKKEQKENDLDAVPKFYVGDFKAYLRSEK